MKILKGDIIVRYMLEEKKETLWKLYEPITISLSNNEILEIPIGFITDFASVPRIFWSAISSIGHYNLASIIHDYFYTYKTKSRKFADEEFLKWMNFTTPNTKIRNYVMYICVRAFGAKRYKRNYLN